MPTRLRKDVQNLALEQNPSSTSKKEKKSSIIDLRGKCESRQQKNSSEICALFWLTTLFRDHHLPFQFLSGSGHIHTWYKPLLKKNEFIYFNWRLITLQYFSGFCQTSIWISQGRTCVPHSEPPPTSLPIPSPRVIPVWQPQTPCIMHRTWTSDPLCIW